MLEDYTVERLKEEFKEPDTYTCGTLVRKISEASIALHVVEGHPSTEDSVVYLKERIDGYEHSLNIKL